MKKLTIAAILCLSANASIAAERSFVCVSDIDGTEFHLTKSGDDSTGSIAVNDIAGAAQVFPGLGNLTFMYVDESNVMTFVVKLPDLNYDLSVQRPQPKNDNGKCKEV